MGSIGVAPGAARLHLVDRVSLLRPEHQVFAEQAAPSGNGVISDSSLYA